MSGSGAAWQRASFGTKRSEVQILSPRPPVLCPGECRHRRHGVFVRRPSFLESAFSYTEDREGLSVDSQFV